MKRFLTLINFLLLLPVSLTPSPLRAASKSDLESFEMVWQIIHDKHWDLAATGKDWDAIGEKYRPRAEAATTRGEIRQIIGEMIAELGQSHFAILEQQHFEGLDELDAKLRSGDATAGIRTGIIEDRLFVVDMDDEAPATKAGVGIGTEILAIEGIPVTETLAKVRQAYSDSIHASFYISRKMNGYLSGNAGSTLNLSVKQQGKTRDIQLELAIPEGETIRLLNLPPFFYRYSDKFLTDDIGYIKFNIFIPQVKTTYDKQSMVKFKDSRGLIIDLRGNGGGLGLIAMSLSNRLVTEKRQMLGVMKNAGSSFNFVVFPQKPIYTQPVAILIDGNSASTSEIMAAGLQDLGRARIFGTKSAGAALPSVIETLPNGDRFQYAIASYTSVKGRELEGNGVIPDELTPHTLDSMARNEDAALKAAIDWIKTENTSKGG